MIQDTLTTFTKFQKYQVNRQVTMKYTLQNRATKLCKNNKHLIKHDQYSKLQKNSKNENQLHT